MNASDPNLDALITASARGLLDEDIEQFNSVDISNTEISDKAIRRIRCKIRNYDKEHWWKDIPISCRKAVASIMLVCTVAFGMCLSVNAVRTEIVNTIMEWYDKFVAVFYISEETSPSIIEEYKEPMLQLAGTERQLITQSDTINQIQYIFDESVVMIYQQNVLDEESVDFDNEQYAVREVEIYGIKAQLFTCEDGTKTITWHDNQYIYVIYTYIEINDDLLIRIAESLQ